MTTRPVTKQSGVAIITVLLMVSLATITVVSMSTKQRLDIRRAGNQQSLQQARALALAGEKFAAATLMRDKKDVKNGKTDSLDDDWAQSLPPIPVDQSTIKGCVFDLQGKFNLNNLVGAEGIVNTRQVENLKRLLSFLSIDESKASAIVDWIDDNSETTGSEGAESSYYSGLDPAYRPANRKMSSISELKMVKGFSQINEDEKSDYELLMPHISALPEITKININTATPAVLASIDEKIFQKAEELSRWNDPIWELYPECENVFDISQLVSKAKEEALSEDDKSPYESIKEFISDTGLTEEELSKNDFKNSLSVDSSFFQIRIEIDSGEVSLSQFSLVKRANNGANQVLQRSRNVF